MSAAKFKLVHNEIQQCWEIYDMRNSKPMEIPVKLCTLSDFMMDRYLCAYLISNGAIEFGEQP